MEIANKIKNSISQEKDIDSEIESFTSILVEIYQNEIERIEFEKETKPYNILGISITNKLIVSTLIAALSVLPASILSNL